MIKQKRAFIAAVLAVIAMSLVPVLIRSTHANEITIGLVRLAIAIALVSPIILLSRPPKLSPLQLSPLQLSPQQWLGLLLVGLVFGLHWLFYFISIKWSSAAIAAIAVSTYGIHLLLLQWLVKRQAIRPLEWLAVFLCFMGCVLVAPSFSLSDKLTLGLLIGIVSGFLYACLPLLHQNLMAIPTFTRAWGQFLFAAIIFLPFSGTANWDLDQNDWWSLAVLGVVCTVIGHSLWVKSSSELPAIATSLIYYLYVPIAMVSSFVFLQEAITPKMVLGAVCILTANTFTAFLAWKNRTRFTLAEESV